MAPNRVHSTMRFSTMGEGRMPMKRAPVERISAMATRSCHKATTGIDMELVAAKAADARANARQREIHAFHAGDDATLHRMLNAVQPGTYVRPHRHSDPPKDEAIILLQGRLAFVAFDDEGQIDEDDLILLDREAGVIGADFRAGVWHTFVVLEPDTVLYEVKPGPYTAASDKDFANWAPEADTPGAEAYLAQLEDQVRSMLGI